MTTADLTTGKAARILAAAEDLILRQGFRKVTMSEIAEKARVGKGTTYLYWRTKEELFLHLMVREFTAVITALDERLAADDDLAQPGRLCAWVVRTISSRPLIKAAHASDDSMLGVLTADPRSTELVQRFGAGALIRRLLPIWRSHGLARADWPLEEQAYALISLAVGFLEAGGRGIAAEAGELDDAGRDRVLAAAVEALLGSQPADADDADDVASAVRGVLGSALEGLAAAHPGH